MLAFAWARTPLQGSGSAFLIWSVPGVVLAALSWSWLRRTGLPALRISSQNAAIGAGVWVALAALALTGVGEEWQLDGMILRNTPERLSGLALRWLPGLFGAVVSVAGLAAALEARYRLTHAAPAPDGAPPATGAAPDAAGATAGGAPADGVIPSGP